MPEKLKGPEDEDMQAKEYKLNRFNQTRSTITPPVERNESTFIVRGKTPFLQTTIPSPLPEMENAKHERKITEIIKEEAGLQKDNDPQKEENSSFQQSIPHREYQIFKNYESADAFQD